MTVCLVTSLYIHMFVSFVYASESFWLTEGCFFCSPVLITCLFFFFLDFFSILLSPLFFLPCLFSPFIVQAEHLLSLWDLISSFFSATYTWRKNIIFSLLSSVSGEKRECHNIVFNSYKVEEAVHLVTCVIIYTLREVIACNILCGEKVWETQVRKEGLGD